MDKVSSEQLKAATRAHRKIISQMSRDDLEKMVLSGIVSTSVFAAFISLPKSTLQQIIKQTLVASGFNGPELDEINRVCNEFKSNLVIAKAAEKERN